MSTISVHCELRYTVEDRSSFYFAVLAARSPRQTVADEQVVLAPDVPFHQHYEIFMRRTVLCKVRGPISLSSTDWPVRQAQ